MLKTPSFLLLLAIQIILSASPCLSFGADSTSSPTKDVAAGNLTREAPSVTLDGNSASVTASANPEEAIAIVEAKTVKAETDIPVVLETQKKEAAATRWTHEPNHFKKI